MSTPNELSVSGADPGDRGVIHDIGYRHYEGPRLGRRYVQRSLFAESLKGAYGLGRSTRSKVMPALLLIAMCLPATVIAIVTSVMGADRLPLGYSAYTFSLQVVIAIYLAAQSPAVASRDLRFRVLSLYFSRPMERVDYVQAKYAGLATAVFLFIALPLTILFVGALLAELPLVAHLSDYLRALVAAALYAVVLAGIALVVAALTPRRGLGVAAVISVFLILSAVHTAAAAVALEVDADTLGAYLGLVSPFALVDGVAQRFLGAEGGLGEGPPGVIGGLVFLVVAGLLVVGCYAALLARYRKVSVS